MSRPEDGISAELQELVATACDGELTDRETERLEDLLSDSAEARRYYLFYFHLHGELHWHEAMAGEMPDLAAVSAEGKGMRIPTPSIARPKPDRISRLRLIGFLICTLAVITLLVLAYRAMPERKQAASPAPPSLSTSAKLTGAVQPRWAAGSAPPATGQAIPLDRRLVLERGAIEIAHGQGNRVLVEGPSAFRYMPGGRIEFESGCATIVVEGEWDYLIDAGGATIEPTGGTIGLSVDAEAVEVHSLGGQALIRQVRSVADALEETETKLEVRDAVAWPADSSEAPRQIAAEPGRFALSLPERAPTHSVAKLRAAAANSARLIHQYPFEGTSRLEKCQDKRGTLNVTEVVMVGGRGRGALDYTAQGLDLTTDAIRPHREPEGGNEIGVALQSEVEFRPPRAMTIELLLRYRTAEDANDETVGLAVATRSGDRDCGFYVAAVGRGHLSLLLDGEADWVETDTVLVPEHWYYVAATFEAAEESTTVSAYVVDLWGGGRQLRQVLKNEVIPGIPAMSRLGIGKGFDDTGAHAYPWSGELDEVAVYDSVLGAEELQAHVDVLRAGGSDLK